MFSTLIDIDTEGNILLHDKFLALVPSMFEVFKAKNMGSKMVKWIVSVEDYKSPYRKLPLEEREEFLTALILEREKTKLTSMDIVVKAREEYKKLQYDPLIDQYNAMSDQIHKMTKVYRSIEPTKENLSELNDIQVQMAKSSEAREKIKQLIIKDQESEIKIQGSGSDEFSMFEDDQRLKGK